VKIIIDTTSTTEPYDNVTSITASSANANFPDDNMRDAFTNNIWQAASGTTATITLGVSKGSAVEILNTNATSVTITAGLGESYEDETDWSLDGEYSYATDEVAVSALEDLPGTGGRIWADYSEFLTPHVVTISITAASVPSAGIVRAGNVEEFRDPGPEHEEASVDFSVEKELNNGADYYRKRNVVRKFTGLSMVETRANAWAFKHDIFDHVGPCPLAIKLFSDASITDDEFIIFAKRVDPPKLRHLTSTLTRISFSLREVI
jgi:hypothetical protein